jgi:hypothetical protein
MGKLLKLRCGFRLVKRDGETWRSGWNDKRAHANEIIRRAPPRGDDKDLIRRRTSSEEPPRGTESISRGGSEEDPEHGTRS